MKNFKKTVAILGTLGVLAISTAAYAAAKTPSQIVSGLTGKTEAVINTERAAGKTYGTIAKDAGKLKEFQLQMLVEKKAVLDQRVKDKTLTQPQADAIYNSIKANQAICNGTGSAAIGRKNGVGFGQGTGCGMGVVRGSGTGMRNGSGGGMGFGAGCR